jgi:hypothetical protein
MGDLQAIRLEPVAMTGRVMQSLEDRGLIVRLGPGRHRPAAPAGRTVDEPLYEPREGYGPHKLIAVTVNSDDLADFGTHPDKEEFLILGEPDCRPLYLVVALHRRTELERIVRERRLSPEDFLALRVRFNDPRVSFFVMLEHSPHGEAAAAGPGRPPSFYVTESRDLPVERLALQGYSLAVQG